MDMFYSSPQSTLDLVDSSYSTWKAFWPFQNRNRTGTRCFSQVSLFNSWPLGYFEASDIFQPLPNWLMFWTIFNNTVNFLREESRWYRKCCWTDSFITCDWRESTDYFVWTVFHLNSKFWVKFGIQGILPLIEYTELSGYHFHYWLRKRLFRLLFTLLIFFKTKKFCFLLS